MKKHPAMRYLLKIRHGWNFEQFKIYPPEKKSAMKDVCAKHPEKVHVLSTQDKNMGEILIT